MNGVGDSGENCVRSVCGGGLPERSGEPLHVGMSSQTTSCFPNAGAQVVFCVGKVVKRLPSPSEDETFKANHCSAVRLAPSDKFHLEFDLDVLDDGAHEDLATLGGEHGDSLDNLHSVPVNVWMYRSLEQWQRW